MSFLSIARRLLCPSLGAFFAFAPALAAPVAQPIAPPPVAPVHPVTDTYFGVSITDPYRWMENLQDPEMKAWMHAQNDYCREVLANIPHRDVLLARIRSLDHSSTSVGDVSEFGGKYFYLKTAPEWNNDRLFVRNGLSGAERMLVDPDLLTKGSTHYSIDYYAPSLDGKYVAYALSSNGSEQSVLHVLVTDTAKRLTEDIDRTRFGGIVWRADNKSFFYTREQKMLPGMPSTDEELNVRVYLHVLGRNPDTDPVVLGPGSTPTIPVTPDENPYVLYSPASPYLFAQIVNGVQNEVRLYVAPLAAYKGASTHWTRVAGYGDDVTGFDSHGSDIYLLSHKNASRFKVLRMSAAHPDIAHASVLIPPSQVVVTGVSCAKDAVYVTDMDGGLGRIRRVGFDGGPAELIPLPYQGSVAGVVTTYDLSGALFLETGWTHSALWYKYDPATNKVADTRLKPLSPISFKNIAAVEVKAQSADGTMIPLSILYAKGTKFDGSHPTLLDGYGAYGISLTPGFSPVSLAWLERGGVLATAHVRGGGEYGEDWHRAGQKLTKQHTIDDFIACALYLIHHKYTSPARLAGEGASAGGITIGGAITQRPELFAAAIDDVGETNALRSEFTPNGPPNIPEFGSVKTLNGFKGLYAMDAQIHIKAGVKYPAVLAITGANDPRVASWEPAKFVAALQAATASGKPVLLRVDYDAGHGIGSTKAQDDSLQADEDAFLFWQLGNPYFQPKETTESAK